MYNVPLTPRWHVIIDPLLALPVGVVHSSSSLQVVTDTWKAEKYDLQYYARRMCTYSIVYGCFLPTLHKLEDKLASAQFDGPAVMASLMLVHFEWLVAISIMFVCSLKAERLFYVCINPESM